MILVSNALVVVLVARQKTLTVGYALNVFNYLVTSLQLNGEVCGLRTKCQN